MITINITWSEIEPTADGKSQQKMKGMQIGVKNSDIKNPMYRARLGREIIESVYKNSGVAIERVRGVFDCGIKGEPKTKKGEYGNPKNI